MALDYLAGATGNPIFTQRSVAIQSTNGVPPSDGLQASGTLTFTGVTDEGELVVIGARTYEFDTGGGVTSGRVAVDISGGASAAQSVTALVAAVNGDSSAIVTAQDGAGNTVVVTADAPGTAGNALATTTTCLNGSWAQITLTGGLADSWTDFRSNLGPFDIEPQEITPLAVEPAGVPPQSLDGKLSLGLGPIELGDLDPSNPMLRRGLANVFGKYDLTDNTTWALWDFNLSGATTAAQWLAFREANNVLPPMRWLGGQFGGFNVSAAPNQNLQITLTGGAEEFDFHGVPVQTVGSGTTIPLFKRTWGGNLSTADKRIYARADTDNTATWVFSFKVGSAASYSDTTIITEGEWCAIYDESGDPIGNPNEQVLMYIPVGWNGVVGNEFIVPQNRTLWTHSLTTGRPISSTGITFFMDGYRKKIEGGIEINAAWENFETFEDTGGRQGATVEKSGPLIVTINPTRRITDLTIQNAIFTGTPMTIVADCVSNTEIGTTGKFYRALMIATAAKPYGKMFAADPGGRNREEVPVFKCGAPAAPFTYTDGQGNAFVCDSHFHFILQNASATI